MYPLTITVFILFIFLLIKWTRYYEFNKKLLKCKGDKIIELSGYNEEEKNTSLVINEIQNYYVNEIGTIKAETQRNNKLLSQWIHNMKTPVSVINLIIQRLKSNTIDINEGIENINEENNMLISNLDQVLDLLRLEDFSKDYIPESTNLVGLLKEVINEKKNGFIYNNIYPKIQVEEENIPVFTDYKWNKVMISQIISNGIKYSSEEGIRKFITFTIIKDEKGVYLAIKDEGIGIESYDLPRVFEPFFTGDNGRKYRNSSGIGLFICKQICDKLNHKIDITSEVGVGTVVKISYLSIL